MVLQLEVNGAGVLKNRKGKCGMDTTRLLPRGKTYGWATGLGKGLRPRRKESATHISPPVRFSRTTKSRVMPT